MRINTIFNNIYYNEVYPNLIGKAKNPSNFLFIKFWLLPQISISLEKYPDEDTDYIKDYKGIHIKFAWLIFKLEFVMHNSKNNYFCL